MLSVGLPTEAWSVEWEFPRNGGCHEGIAFADGTTGILVWGGGDTINLTVGRSDLRDRRGGCSWFPAQSYTNVFDYMFPLGRVVVKMRGRTVESGSLDPFSGLGDLVLDDGGRVEMAMSKSARAFAMNFPKGVECEVKTVPATDMPEYEGKLRKLKYEKAKVLDMPGSGVGGMRWKLPSDEGVWLSWVCKGSDFSFSTGRGSDCAFMEASPFGLFAAESVGHWSGFWKEHNRVSVPDPAKQDALDYDMYRIGAMGGRRVDGKVTTERQPPARR